jgi:hypothetical protein
MENQEYTIEDLAAEVGIEVQHSTTDIQIAESATRLGIELEDYHGEIQKQLIQEGVVSFPPPEPLEPWEKMSYALMARVCEAADNECTLTEEMLQEIADREEFLLECGFQLDENGNIIQENSDIDVDDLHVMKLLNEACGDDGENATVESLKLFVEDFNKRVKFDYEQLGNIDTWKLQSATETYKTGKGICHDQSLALFDYLKEQNDLNMTEYGQLFFVEFKNGSNVGGQTHTLCWVLIDGKYYSIDSCFFHGVRGPYATTKEMELAIVEMLNKEGGDTENFNGIVVSYDRGNYKVGMTLAEYVESWNGLGKTHNRKYNGDGHINYSKGQTFYESCNVLFNSSEAEAIASTMNFNADYGDTFFSESDTVIQEAYAPKGIWLHPDFKKQLSDETEMTRADINNLKVELWQYLVQFKRPAGAGPLTGTDGAFKYRSSDYMSNQGKRGGIRVIHTYIGSQSKIVLLMLFPKSRVDENLTHGEKVWCCREIKKLKNMEVLI